MHDESSQKIMLHSEHRLSEVVTRNLKTPKMAAIAVSVVILLAALIFTLFRTQLVANSPNVSVSAEESANETVISVDLTSVVHIIGAVNKPGVYSLEPDARVHDALDAAGGPTDAAALQGINLARVINDGEQLRIPTHEEWATEGNAGLGGAGLSPGGASGSSASTVNLNVASASELETLPGIGPALAQRIVDWRSANGNFSTVDDLDAVAGIGTKMLDRIRDLVTV
jgi:competence protein ComEA